MVLTPSKDSDADKMAVAGSPLVAPGTSSGGDRAGFKSPLWDLKEESRLERMMSDHKSGRASLMGSALNSETSLST